MISDGFEITGISTNNGPCSSDEDNLYSCSVSSDDIITASVDTGRCSGDEVIYAGEDSVTMDIRCYIPTAASIKEDIFSLEVPSDFTAKSY